MARVGTEAPVDQQEVKRPPQELEDKIKVFLEGVYKELSGYVVEFDVDYSAAGVRRLFELVVKARGYLNRLEAMSHQIQRVRRDLERSLEAARASLEDHVEAALLREAQALIARNYAFEERKAHALQGAIDLRLRVRKLERLVRDLETAARAVEGRYRHLLDAKADVRLLTSLVQMGEGLGEVRR